MRQLSSVSEPQEHFWFQSLEQRAELAGLALRGAFHPASGEFEQLSSLGPLGTVILLGFTADLQWPIFAQSSEAKDGLAHPLDRWSHRVIGALAREVGARDFYPDDAPRLPFQQLAMRCEAVHPSPIGLLIHPRWGLWHAYRGGLTFADRLPLPPRTSAPSPCASCEAKPCLNACPVGAFSFNGYHLAACVAHVSSLAGAQCRQGGCLARHACPVGPAPGYAPQQRQFHMNAFLAAFKAGDRAG